METKHNLAAGFMICALAIYPLMIKGEVVGSIVADGCDSVRIVKENWATSGAPKIVQIYCSQTLVGEIGFHENGVIGYRGKYHNSKQDGKWVWWNENGKIKRIVNVSHGILNGFSVTFFENGLKESEGHFFDGKETGIWRYWYLSGEIKYEIETTKGIENGIFKEYYENGILKIEGNKTLGLRDGEWLLYSKEGDVICTALYRADKLVNVSGKCEEF